MSAATTSDLTLPLLGGYCHFLLRRLHSLTGIMFGGYLIVHLIINSTILQRGLAYQTQVNKIHEIVWLSVVEWSFIFLPIIFHTLYGVWIICSGQPNNISYPYGKNWFYLLQRISAIYIVGFIVFHVLSLKYAAFAKELAFDPHQALRTIDLHMHYNPIIAWVIYPLGILASAYHTANGFWAAAITWGLTISASAQRRWGWLCVGVFMILLVAGMVSLVAAATQPIPPATGVMSHE